MLQYPCKSSVKIDFGGTEGGPQTEGWYFEIAKVSRPLQPLLLVLLRPPSHLIDANALRKTFPSQRYWSGSVLPTTSPAVGERRKKEASRFSTPPPASASCIFGSIKPM
ncbi:unnamed protein product [Chondrus crispus]|uniref:Uncharacterized protein n=1 Tax=Chondrus crispus TaxID=2769 RepID=R7QE21_CHOCR|nr:unnamed protein product [Chondrus crispus]CDF36334.1 unnamed protein product [Chondrus crispus]|eukprot:XP_005716153.1 unnamed protein product [Chondrus crispus]